jgi:hypothetical protein
MTMAALPDSLPAGKVAVIRPRNEVDRRFLPAFEQALPNPQGVRVRFSWPTGLFKLDGTTGPHGTLRSHELKVKAVKQRAAARAEVKRSRISARQTRAAKAGLMFEEDDDEAEDEHEEPMPPLPWFLAQTATEVKPTWAAVSSLDPMMPMAGLLGMAIRAPEVETPPSSQPGQLVAASSPPAFAGSGCLGMSMHKLASLHQAARDAQRWRSGLQAVPGSAVEEHDSESVDMSDLGSSFAEEDEEESGGDPLLTSHLAELGNRAAGGAGSRAFADSSLSRSSSGPASRQAAAGVANAPGPFTARARRGVLDRLRSIDAVHMEEDDHDDDDDGDALSEGMSRLSLSSPVPEDDWRSLGQIEEQGSGFGDTHLSAARGIHPSAALLTPELDELGLGFALGTAGPPPNLV